MGMGGSIYPSGSLERVGVVDDGWASPTVYRPVIVPVGAMVEIALGVGVVWGGKVGVVVERLVPSGGRSVVCRVVGVSGAVDLPEYVLRVLSPPPGDDF